MKRGKRGRREHQIHRVENLCFWPLLCGVLEVTPFLPFISVSRSHARLTLWRWKKGFLNKSGFSFCSLLPLEDGFDYPLGNSRTTRNCYHFCLFIPSMAQCLSQRICWSGYVSNPVPQFSSSSDSLSFLVI